jgi:hypothetical protein
LSNRWQFATPDLAPTGKALIDQLENIPSGNDEWSAYQKLIGDILEFLFCPPLEKPIPERSNRPRTNRRDFILPNYAPEGSLWAYMRTHYSAYLVVVDAKNSGRNINKKEILQVGNYLSSHGTGLFGVIMSRKGIKINAEETQREQWAFHRKLILVLDDTEVKQMIVMRIAGEDPAGYIRQVIEDFRLAF